MKVVIQANDTGLTLKLHLYDIVTGNIVKISDLSVGAFSTGQWANYKLVLAEDGGSGSGSKVYQVTIPAIPPGVYKAMIYNEVAPGSPSIVNDEAFGEYDHIINWDGTTDVTGFLSLIKELTTDPGATPRLDQVLSLLYMAMKNGCQAVKIDTVNGTRKIKNAAGATVLQAATSDDGATYDQGKLA